jgi:hypothetical protein
LLEELYGVGFFVDGYRVKVCRENKFESYFLRLPVSAISIPQRRNEGEGHQGLSEEESAKALCVHSTFT